MFILSVNGTPRGLKRSRVKRKRTLQSIYMLSPILCSSASSAKSTVRNLPHILHIHAIWMSRSFSDCSIVLFWTHENHEAEWERSMSRVCVPKLKSCCAATTWGSLLRSSECETEFWLIEGFVWGSALDVIRFLPVFASGPHLDALRCSLFTPVRAAAGCSQRSRRFLLCSWQQTSCPLSLCPPAGALWVTGSQRRSVIVLESCHWPRYDGSGTESIVGTPIEYLHPFANEVWQGIHTRSHRRAAGCARRWLRWNS